MIILEGPDGSGKTTLLKQLAEAMDMPIAPRVVSKETKAMVDLRDWVDNNLDEGFQPMLFDRHRLISETIYGPVLRKKQQPGFTQLSWLGPRMKRFYELEPIIIYCLPPLDEVKKNLFNDLDNLAVESSIEQLYTAYASRAALDHTFAPGIVKVWDYTTTPTIQELPLWFYEIADKVQERVSTK